MPPPDWAPPPSPAGLEEQMPVMAQHVDLQPAPDLDAMNRYVEDPSLSIQQDARDHEGIRIGKNGVVHRVLGTARLALVGSSYTADAFVKVFEFCAQWSLYIILGYTTGRVVQYRDDTEGARLAETSFDCACAMPCDTVVNASAATDGTCAESAMATSLPEKNTVYMAAGIFAACKICQGGASFIGSRKGQGLKDRLVGTYGKLSHVAEEKARIALPHIDFDDFDYARTVEGVIGILCIGGGNWLVSKDYIASGLLAIMFGAMVVSDAITGFANTQQTVVRGFLRYCDGMLDCTSDGIGPQATSAIRRELNEVRAALGTSGWYRPQAPPR